ncbi:MAG: amino acid--tRNA ligase-related protein, partial [Patescibacteria group bacterium]
MERTYIGDLIQKVGEEVKINGWVDVRRDHGKLIFLDIRDASGKVQAVALPNHAEAHEISSKLRPEWVIEATAKVNKRPERMINKNEPNGEIELEFLSVTVLNEASTPPFDISGDGMEIGEDNRLKYRYVDLRRARLQKNIRTRSAITTFIRNFLSDKKFVEIETPILTKSTPEGARDYVVPSRLYHGKFYALPQSPQQYKQLLMTSGFEKYFQIARCFRDEDTRGDRQPEFTQMDLEMSFVNREDVIALIEALLIELVETISPEKKIQEKPFPRMSYKDAMD